MNTQLFLRLVSVVILTVSCGEVSDKAYEESMDDQNEITGSTHESDTNIIMHDGRMLSDAMDQLDSLTLPPPILEAITMDDAVSVDEITSKLKFEEGGKIYYSVSFMRNGEQSLTMIYDEHGKPKSLD